MYLSGHWTEWRDAKIDKKSTHHHFIDIENYPLHFTSWRNFSVPSVLHMVPDSSARIDKNYSINLNFTYSKIFIFIIQNYFYEMYHILRQECVSICVEESWSGNCKIWQMIICKVLFTDIAILCQSCRTLIFLSVENRAQKYEICVENWKQIYAEYCNLSGDTKILSKIQFMKTTHFFYRKMW